MFSKLLSRDAGQKVTRGVDSHRYTLFLFFFLDFDAEKKPLKPHSIGRKQLLSFLVNKTEAVPFISTCRQNSPLNKSIFP